MRDLESLLNYERFFPQVTFSGIFAGDSDAGVVQDGRFKRRDALKDLAAYIAKKA